MNSRLLQLLVLLFPHPFTFSFIIRTQLYKQLSPQTSSTSHPHPIIRNPRNSYFFSNFLSPPTDVDTVTMYFCAFPLRHILAQSVSQSVAWSEKFMAITRVELRSPFQDSCIFTNATLLRMHPTFIIFVLVLFCLINGSIF
jgi:hypothetical protein